MFMNRKLSQISIHSAPFALGIALAFFLWEQNLILLICYLVITIVFIVTGKDQKAESGIAIYGLIAALVIEALGTSVSGYQTFNNPSFWGIPVWLPVSFSYGFILMKRIGLIIATGSPWAKPIN
jgi:hypothetical protein